MRRMSALAALALVLASGSAEAAGVPLPPVRPALAAPPPADPAMVAPLPPPRPAEQGPPLPTVQGPPAPPIQGPPMPARPAGVAASASAEAPPGASEEEERLCARLLTGGRVVARASAPQGGPGGCGMAAPVEVSALTPGAGRRIRVAPPIDSNCAVATALAAWVAEDLVALFDKAGLPLTGVVGSSGYSCRGRNHVVGARLSEHGQGNAIDIGGFATAASRVIGVKDGPADLLAEIRRTACARFSTVLGPGSDSYHETHLHIDLEARRNGAKLCQWDMPPADTAPKQNGPMPRPGTAPGQHL